MGPRMNDWTRRGLDEAVLTAVNDANDNTRSWRVVAGAAHWERLPRRRSLAFCQ